jgi:hypothetical protein
MPPAPAEVGEEAAEGLVAEVAAASVKLGRLA